MKKSEYIEQLTKAGKTEEELKGLKLEELKKLFQALPKEETEKPEIDKPYEIISKRKDEYWLREGFKVAFEEVKQYAIKEGLAPQHKAKDFATLTKDGWILTKKEDI